MAVDPAEAEVLREVVKEDFLRVPLDGKDGVRPQHRHPPPGLGPEVPPAGVAAAYHLKGKQVVAGPLQEDVFLPVLLQQLQFRQAREVRLFLAAGKKQEKKGQQKGKDSLHNRTSFCPAGKLLHPLL